MTPLTKEQLEEEMFLRTAGLVQRIAYFPVLIREISEDETTQMYTGSSRYEFSEENDE